MVNGKIVPPKLVRGSNVRVVAPAYSASLLSEDQIEISTARLSALGCSVTFGKNAMVARDDLSSSVAGRVADLNEAFADESVDAIFTVIGGYDSHETLRHLDFDLIRNNPKIFCGYSDITAITCAIWARANVVTYSGPHFSTLSMIENIDYTMCSLEACLVRAEPYSVGHPDRWSDDEWYMDQVNREFMKDEGPKTLRPGTATGTLVGGNLGTLRLLQGTPYCPDLSGSILFLEEAAEVSLPWFRRNIQSLAHVPSFAGVRGLLFGRFVRSSGIRPSDIDEALTVVGFPADLPVVCDVPFGHSAPHTVLPIGGDAIVNADVGSVSITVTVH